MIGDMIKGIRTNKPKFAEQTGGKPVSGSTTISHKARILTESEIKLLDNQVLKIIGRTNHRLRVDRNNAREMEPW